MPRSAPPLCWMSRGIDTRVLRCDKLVEARSKAARTKAACSKTAPAKAAPKASAKAAETSPSEASGLLIESRHIFIIACIPHSQAGTVACKRVVGVAEKPLATTERDICPFGRLPHKTRQSTSGLEGCPRIEIKLFLS